MDCQESASESGDNKGGKGCWEATSDPIYPDNLSFNAMRKTTLWANTDPETLPPQNNGAWIAQGQIEISEVDEDGNPTGEMFDLNLTGKAKDYQKLILAWSENNQRYLWRHRGPRHSRLIQLAFHDCLRYEDGTGGCDGCLNWDGMGWTPPSVNKWGFEDPGSNEDAEDAATGSENDGRNCKLA